jgi:hypothetical protein
VATVLPTTAQADQGPITGTATGRRLFRHPDLTMWAMGLAIGIGVCWPLIGGRPLFLLDWVTGPRPPFPSPAMLGLDGGLTAGVGAAVGMTFLVCWLGEAATWLVLFAVFPLAAVGAGRLAGRSRWCRVAAGCLYAVNPWVFNRVYAGQLTLLLGYALLPWAVASALRVTRSGGNPTLTAFAGPALWWTALTALSPHFSWIYGVVLVALAIVTRPWSPRVLLWLGLTVAAFVVTSLYILLPHSATELPTHVGPTSLALYRTRGSRRFGLFVNVLGLYGFWRLGPGPTLPKSVIGGWPLLLAGLLVLVLVGYLHVLRSSRATSVEAGPAAATPVEGSVPGEGRPNERRLAWAALVLGVAGYLLALGNQGPTGPVFSWLYFHIFFFQVMREPQKFLMLTALAYALGFGWGVDRVVRAMAREVRRRGSGSTARSPGDEPGDEPGGPPGGPPGTGRGRWAVAAWAAALAVILPLGYTPTMFDGLAGQIAPSTIPPSYAQANRLMGNGPGRVLYLPWHLYERQPFTHGRVVATPGPSLFSRTVIAGDNVQIGPVQTQSTSLRSAYVERLLVEGPRLSAFGAAVAPLGVRWVVLAKTVDWLSYSWLARQGDLRRVLDDPTLEVFENLSYRGVGHRHHTTRPVRQLSLVAYRVPRGSPGTVTIDAAYQPGWVLDGVAGHPTATGTVAFSLRTPRGGIAVFAPWRLVRLGAALSGAAALVLLLLAGWDHLRDRAVLRDPRAVGQPSRHARH